MSDLAERALPLVQQSFIASAGPGDQNVNKVATAVQIRLDVFALRLSPPVFARLKSLAGSRMTAKGEIILTARTFRTQDANREEARARLLALLEDAEKLPALDQLLWNFRADSFIGHSAERDGSQKDQPVFLTVLDDNPNDGNVRFMVENAVPPSLEPYTRGIYIFDGHNEAALAHARERWKAEKAAGHEVTYWQQKPNGGWEKKA